MLDRNFIRGLGVGVLTASLVLAGAFLASKPKITDAEIMKRAEALGMMTEDQFKQKSLDRIKDKAISGSETSESISSEEEEKNDSDSKEKDIKEEEDKKTDKESESKDKSGVTVKVSEKDGAVATGATIIASEPAEDKKETKKTEVVSSEKTSKTDSKETAAKKKSEKKTKDSAAAEANKTSSNDKSVTITVTGGMYSETVAKKLEQAGIIESAADFNSYLVRNGFSDKIRVGSHRVSSGMSYGQIAAALTGK